MKGALQLLFFMPFAIRIATSIIRVTGIRSTILKEKMNLFTHHCYCVSSSSHFVGYTMA
jgi:hypothetical protein